MKNLFVSAGLLAAGVASVRGADALEGGDDSKIWSVSASLKNFYDDNYTTAHSGGKGSYGAELSPSFNLTLPLQQTDLGFRYIYGLYYYKERASLGQNPYDQTHQFDFWLDHAFN